MNSKRSLRITMKFWPIKGSFTIARGTKTEVAAVNVVIEEGGIKGHGECVPYPRYGESQDSVAAQIRKIQSELESGITRAGLQRRLKPGAARYALDAALWDLEAKLAGKRAWEIAGIEVAPVITVYTLSLAAPEQMELDARKHRNKPILKLKLGGAGDLQRVAAVRRGHPAARIIVDANESWDRAMYEAFVPELLALGVEMIEQPFPVQEDGILKSLERPVTVCADESCHDRKTLGALKDKYDMINIKLDKSGGLTEALAMKSQAETLGFQVMTGCMLGSSLAMAPALLVAQGSQLVDLDGPLLLADDCQPPLRFNGVQIYPPEKELWG